MYGVGTPRLWVELEFPPCPILLVPRGSVGEKKARTKFKMERLGRWEKVLHVDTRIILPDGSLGLRSFHFFFCSRVLSHLDSHEPGYRHACCKSSAQGPPVREAVQAQTRGGSTPHSRCSSSRGELLQRCCPERHALYTFFSPPPCPFRRSRRYPYICLFTPGGTNGYSTAIFRMEDVRASMEPVVIKGCRDNFCLDFDRIICGIQKRQPASSSI